MAGILTALSPQMAVPPTKTKEGYEPQFGINHMGHFLLTKLLFPTLIKTAALPNSDVRIINLSSSGHILAPRGGIDFDHPDLPNSGIWTRYGQSKLANIKFTQALSDKYPNITSVAIHPGGVGTNLMNTWFQSHKRLEWFVMSVAKTVEDGAKNQLWAAVAPKGEGFGKVESGSYYTPVGIKNKGNRYVTDAQMKEKLWNWSEEELKKYRY